MEAFLFLCKLSVFTLGGWTLFYPFEGSLQALLATLSQNILRVLGLSIQAGGSAIHFYAGTNLIEISPLCSGLVEMLLLSGAILATHTRTVESRVRGVLVGVGILFVFNLVRIVITIMQLEHTSLEFATFTHDVLFRIVLIIGFALVYVSWLNFSSIKKWAQEKECIA